MPNDLLQQLWQDQPTETISMPLDEIRRKAEAFHAKARFAALAMVVGGLGWSVLASSAFLREQTVLPRIAWALLAGWGLFTAIRTYVRAWPERLAADATPQTCLSFYRGELERQRDYISHVWRRSGLPVAFAGLALLVIPPIAANPQLAPKALPVFLVLVVWFAIFVPQRKRKQRKLQREIEELEALERDAQ